MRWRKDNVAAFEFASEPFDSQDEFTCNDFHARQIRRWRWKAGGILSHCRFESNPDARLNRLHLWIKNTELGNTTYLRVFSDEYLAAAPYDFARTLQNQGETLGGSEPLVAR